MRVSHGKTKTCWPRKDTIRRHNKAKRWGIAWPSKQALRTIKRTIRAIKLNQHAWNPTKNKKYHGKQLDNGCLRYLHYYPKRKSTIRTIESNLQV